VVVRCGDRLSRYAEGCEWQELFAGDARRDAPLLHGSFGGAPLGV